MDLRKEAWQFCFDELAIADKERTLDSIRSAQIPVVNTNNRPAGIDVLQERVIRSRETCYLQLADTSRVKAWEF